MSRNTTNVQTGSAANRFSENSSLTDLAKNAPGVYRCTSIGVSLRTVLDQLFQEKKISAFQQSCVVSVFDRKMSTAIGQLNKGSKYTKILPVDFTAEKVVKGKYVDGLWTATLKDVTIDPYRNPIRLDRAQLIVENYSDKSVDQFKTIQAITGNTTNEMLDLSLD